MIRFDVITLFPELVRQVGAYGVASRALSHGLFSLKTWNPRDFTSDVHRTVDDRPYGGGPGMVMLYQPLADALEAARQDDAAEATVIHLSPRGRPLNQERVNRFASASRLVLVSGRYEGIDQRFIDKHVDEEVSIGDFVVSGGEIPAMLLIDAVVRQLPGALGHVDSAQQDSFMNGLLDYPHYSRPEVVDEQAVPEVLLSGHHEKIARWRRRQALKSTLLGRPDLLDKVDLAPGDEQIIEELKTGSRKPE